MARCHTVRKSIATGSHRRDSKHRVASADRWLHLSSGEVGVQFTLQSIWTTASLLTSYSLLCLSMVMNIGNLAGPSTDQDAIQDLISLSLQNTIYFVIFMQI